MKRPSPDSPYDTLEAAFGVLCTGPRPLVLDGVLVDGLPKRPIPLDELRGILLHPSTGPGTANQALGLLLGRARREGGQWTVALAGTLLFGLYRATAPLCQVCPERIPDIEAEALAGLIEGIASTDPARRGLAARLVWLARNRAKRLVARELAQQGRPGHQPASQAPRHPWGHPDLVLVQAVAEGVLCADDAALIGDTRLGDSTVAQEAEARGISVGACVKRRQRAEVQLASWLAKDFEPFVQIRPVRPYLVHGGRPRQGRTPDRRSATCQSRPNTTRR